MTLSDLDKLRVLLPLWIEHNRGHETDFLEWVEKSRALGQPQTSALILQAIVGLKAAEEALTKALDSLGGGLPRPEHHHHHH